jgi:hypothetical protein
MARRRDARTGRFLRSISIPRLGRALARAASPELLERFGTQNPNGEWRCLQYFPPGGPMLPMPKSRAS